MEYTEEENKSMANLKFKLNLDKEDYNEDYIDMFNLYDNRDVETILNLIEKQQKEINELKQENEYLNCICESDASNYINKEAIRESIKNITRNVIENEENNLDKDVYAAKAIVSTLKELLGE